MSYNFPNYPYVVKIASKNAVDSGVLATYNLNFESSLIDLTGFIPLFFVIKRNGAGLLTIVVAQILVNGVAVTPLLPLVGVTGTANLLTFNSGVAGGYSINAKSGNISIQITTASIGASSIDVLAYGIKL